MLFQGARGAPIELIPEGYYVVDEEVARHHPALLSNVLKSKRIVFVEANEKNKSLDGVSKIIQSLSSLGMRRGDKLIAIGGGITQDLTCFVASCIFRGVEWIYYPTTLLSQSDSCIGSKSSINVGGYKNLAGNFYPPERIEINNEFLRTLTDSDICSGIGEIIKVHVVSGSIYVEDLILGYPAIKNPDVLQEFIYKSLFLKKAFVEIDEFDKNERLVMNYGHTFGHALETSSNNLLPHGIAVTIGMNMANTYALHTNRISQQYYSKIEAILIENAKNYLDIKINFDNFIAAISKDKKNIGNSIALILPIESGGVERVLVENDNSFKEFCRDYFLQSKSNTII